MTAWCICKFMRGHWHVIKRFKYAHEALSAFERMAATVKDVMIKACREEDV